MSRPPKENTNFAATSVEFDPFADGEILLTVPTSEPQKEIWLSVQLGGDAANCAYNESVILTLHGPVNVPALQKAIEAAVNRHEALRGSISPDGNAISIVNEIKINVDYVDAAALPASERDIRFKELLDREVTLPFDLAHGPLFRATIVKNSDAEYVLVFTGHHIVLDGWSTALLIGDIDAAYSAFLKNSAYAPPAPVQFSEYVKFIASPEQRAARDRVEQYWIDRFSDAQPVLELPTSHNRPLRRTFEAEAQVLVIEKEVIAGLKKLGGRAKCSLTVTMLAGLKILMHRLSGQDDLVVGIPAAGQSSSGMEQLVGHCVNILPIRSNLKGDQTVLDYLTKLQKIMLDAYEHQDFTFGSLLKKLKIQRDAARVPLVSALFNIDPGITDLSIGGVTATVKTNLRKYENFEWFINGTNLNGEVRLECHYNKQLFDDVTMTRRLAEFNHILGEMVRFPDRQIDALNPLPDEEYELQVRGWNDTARDYPREKCVHELFSLQAASRSTEIALEFGRESLTYGELEQRSNSLSQYLKSIGTGPGMLVGIFVDRSIEMVVALLGILKSGAAYVPLDPDYPEERLRYMIQDGNIQTILTRGDLRPPNENDAIRVINLSGSWDQSLPADAADYSLSDTAPGPEDTAYVIYTSGSTGRPKGVEIPHRAFVNFLTSVAKEPGITKDDVLTAVTTLSFDIAGLEIFLPLISGAKVRVVDRDTAMDAPMLIAELEASGTTLMQATPSTWRMLLNAGWNGSLKMKVLCGGEPFPRDLVRQLIPKCKEVWNMYGPTETTVWSTCCKLSDPEEKILIGRPIGNTQCYILDSALNPTPIGVAGELYIGGDGLAKGYRNKPELTSNAFIPNPFRQNERIYKTGDLARYQTDGRLEYLNRIDNQVKVRGFRIELGEIEAALETLPAVSSAAAKVHDFGMSDIRIIAYFTVHSGETVQEVDARKHLRTFLPEYMIPQHFVALDVLPLTPAGKVDKKNLPIPDIGLKQQSADHVFPQTKTEERVLSIWQSNLGSNTPISTTADFFQLGGHSLLATRTLANIKKEFGCAISLRAFFEHPTINGLSDLIDKATTETEAPAQVIQKRPDRLTAPLSLQQRRLWYLDKLESGTIDLNLPGRRRIRGPVNVSLMEECIRRIFERHEILRTSIKDADTKAGQVIDREYQFNLPVLDLRDVNETEREKVYTEDMMRQVQSAFDLSRLPLIRIKLYILTDTDHVLFFMPHHIIWDGWSFDIFHNELNLLYTAGLKNEPPVLPELPVQYGDFATWQTEWAQSAVLEEHLAFWKQKLGGTLPVLELAADYPRPPVLTHNHGATAFFSLNKDLIDRLTESTGESGATLFMILLSAYNLLLHQYTGGQKDIIVGAPISGRNHDEINNLIGFFVNTLILRCKIDPANTYTDFLKETKRMCLEAFNYQDTPFERIVEVLNPPRDLSRTPIFQAAFAYQDVRNRKKHLAGMPYEQLNIARPGVQTDLEYWVRLSDEGIAGGFDYNCDLFKKESIEQMARHYEEIVRRIAETPTASLKEICAVPLDQYELQIRKWNASQTSYPQGRCVHDLFKRQSDRTPEKTAVAFGDESVTYKELDLRADRLAATLIHDGMRPGDLVGIYMERSIDMVVAMLGIHKAGGGYVPLDPDYPVERLQYMIRDAGLQTIVTQSTLDPPADAHAIRLIRLDVDLTSTPAAIDLPILKTPPDAETIAYVIYTSGSTGTPKGVRVPHRALVNFLTSMQQRPGITEDDVLLAVTTLSFDIAELELWLPLVTGAKVVIADRETAWDAHALINTLRNTGATYMQATPGTWRLITAAGWEGDKRLKALCGGEAFPADLAKILVERCGEVWNMYGPTETTVWSTCYQITDGDSPILIGRPIGNTQLFILDENMQPTPVGVPGELFIGGDGVTHGYHNKSELTEKVFLQSPFAKEFPRPTIYKTGDLCRFRPDGNLEYLQRIDTQVKIRGYRIELGEIESQLASHNAVKQAVAVVKEAAPGDVRLAAYVLPVDGEEVTGTELRRHLRKSLPDYMIPQYFLIETEPFPLTPAGKIDRKQLQRRFKVGGVEEDTIIEPSSADEKYLAGVWKEVLHAAAVSTHHNFFNIGGHSLLAMQVISRIASDTGIRISPRELLMSTLGQIASQYQFSVGAEPQQEAAPPERGFLKSIKNKIKDFR